MKYPPEKGFFLKIIVFGHYDTFQIVGKESFHDICRFGSHFYIDTRMYDGKIQLLKNEANFDKYLGIKKEKNIWIEYSILDRK